MANGLTTRFPVVPDAKFPGGFVLIETYKDLVKQNLKNLILTAPGEKFMDPYFGVGARNYLFELETDFLVDDLREKILAQISRYLRYIEIEEIVVELEEHYLHVKLQYYVKSLGIKDLLTLGLDREGTTIDE